jgi:Zn-dependent M28 family amino/carboxypeptidase
VHAGQARSMVCVGERRRISVHEEAFDHETTKEVHVRTRNISLALFLTAFSLVCCRTHVVRATIVSFPEIDGDAVLGHTKILSSDAFEGRGTGTRGEEKTVNYIVEEFRKAGLRPGNTDGTFIQAVPLAGITANSDLTLTFEKEGQRRNLNPKNDFVAWTRRLVGSVELKNSDVVFVGYGVKAPEYDWDDYKTVDVRGKTLIMLVGDPPVPDPADPTKLDPKTFGGKAMTYYGRWTYKYEIGAQREAAAVIIVHETEPAGYPFSVVQGNVGERFDLIRPDKNLGRVKVEGWIPLEQAHELFKMAGQDCDTLKSAAATRAFRPVELRLTASIRINNTIRVINSRNVLGKVEGSDPALKDEYVIYTSHWDHFGIGKEIDGDNIYHGAVDNATGIGGLIEIARAFLRPPHRPKRSILFLAVTAEEQGLLGSEYYAANPIYPLAKTLGVINMDALNVHGKTSDVVIVGLGNSDLDDVATQVAAEQGRVIKPDPMPEKGFFYRSDHFPFVLQGVPALSSRDGVDYVGKPAGYGMQIMNEYISQHYHKPSDIVRPDWDMSGAVQQLQYYWMIGYRVAEADKYPQWKPGAEFKRKEAHQEAVGDHRPQ